MIEQKMANIVDSFHAKLDPFNRKTVHIEQIEKEPVDEHFLVEVIYQNSQSYEFNNQHEAYSNEVVA